MHRPIRAVLTVLAVAPLALAACGDDDADASALSEDEYIAAGTAVCEAAGPRIVEAFPDPVGEPDVEYLRSIAGPIADVMDEARGEFAELDPPETKREGHEALLDAIDHTTTQLRAVLEDDDAADAMLAEGPPLDGPAAAAEDLGLEGCGA